MAKQEDLEQPLVNKAGANNEEVAVTNDGAAAKKAKKGNSLLSVFLAMVVIGLGNKLFQIFQAIPMHNYPYFLNVLTTFVYVPVSFAYILPMLKWGTAITDEARRIPKRKFAVMGCLDSLAGIMQTFAVNYITNRGWNILLQQAAIPVSMAISRCFLRTQYNKWQYIGAAVTMAGIFTVVIPSVVGGGGGGIDGGQLLWMGVMVLSCVPMCLSSVYKEKALGEVDVDVVYLNGWVATFQFLVSLPLAFPSALVSKIPVRDIPGNLYDGLNCFGGVNTRLHDTGGVTRAQCEAHANALPGCRDDCHAAPTFVSLYLVFNVIYNILIILILKLGSANVLWLAMTVMVPLGNVTFYFVPVALGRQPFKATDVVGLCVIMAGLITYRFMAKIMKRRARRGRSDSFLEGEPGEAEAAKKTARLVGIGYGAEMAASGLQCMVETYAKRAAVRLLRTPLEIRSGYLRRLGIPTPPGLSPLSRDAYRRAQKGSVQQRGGGGGGGGKNPGFAAWRSRQQQQRQAAGNNPPPRRKPWNMRQTAAAATAEGGIKTYAPAAEPKYTDE